MSEKVLMCGNEAVAEAAIQAGLDAFFGYPITPQNEIPEYMSRRMPEEGRVFVQSESEIAAINMVYGAAATGARAMTSSSSPGISLKQEGISYLAGSQLPAVIVNMMRGGPGLGNIEPSQSDYFQATRGGGHGDYYHIALAGNSVQEMADLMYDAFDLADKYRGPVMVIGDGILAQMIEPVDVFAKKRPPIQTDKSWALGNLKDRSPNIVNSLFLGDNVLENHNLRLQAKYQIIRDTEVRFEATDTEDADLIVVAYGIASRIASSAIRKARKKGLKVGLFRPITLWPFPAKPIAALAGQGRKFLAVELSYGQMVEDVRLAVNGASPVDFYGRAGGSVPTVEAVLEKIEENLK
ncbi:MAG: 3-methyl-2-oxobutanoate dehydrogenase subunit VorB [Phycisphaerae bacterium]|nr:3-methyl-2-oxobutanoate dehydrogenase subunit VorB [Phycisphaerae bacterium]